MERKEWGDVAGNEEQGSNTPKREKKEAMEKESTEYRNNLNVCLAKKKKKKNG